MKAIEQVQAERQAKVRRLNALTREVRELDARLKTLEAHDGADGSQEDIEGQCVLVDEIAQKRREIAALRREVYL